MSDNAPGQIPQADTSATHGYEDLAATMLRNKILNNANEIRQIILRDHYSRLREFRDRGGAIELDELIFLYAAKPGETQRQLAQKLGVSEQRISERLRRLEAWKTLSVLAEKLNKLADFIKFPKQGG